MKIEKMKKKKIVEMLKIVKDGELEDMKKEGGYIL